MLQWHEGSSLSQPADMNLMRHLSMGTGHLLGLMLNHIHD